MRKLKFNSANKNTREKKPNTHAGRFWKKAGMIATVLTSATSVFAIDIKQSHALVSPARAQSAENHSRQANPRSKRTYLNKTPQIMFMAGAAPKAVQKMVTKQLTIKVVPARRLRRELGRRPTGPAFIDKGKLVLHTPVSNNNFLVARVDPSLGKELPGIVRKMIGRYFQNPKVSSFNISVKVRVARPAPVSGRGLRGRRPGMGRGLSVTPAKVLTGLKPLGAAARARPRPTVSKGRRRRTTRAARGIGSLKRPFIVPLRGARKTRRVNKFKISVTLRLEGYDKATVTFQFVIPTSVRKVTSTDIKSAIERTVGAEKLRRDIAKKAGVKPALDVKINQHLLKISRDSAIRINKALRGR